MAIPLGCTELNRLSLLGLTFVKRAFSFFDHNGYVLRDNILMTRDGKHMIRDLCEDRTTAAIPSSVTLISAGCFFGKLTLREVIFSPDCQL
jgi:hypothetical protein